MGDFLESFPNKIENENGNFSFETINIKLEPLEENALKQEVEEYNPPIEFVDLPIKQEWAASTSDDALHIENGEQFSKIKQEQNVISCDICLTIFKNKAYLKRHKERIHLKSAEDTDKETNTCPICFKNIKNKYNLKKHIKFLHERKPEDWFQCKLCPYKSIIRSNCQRHELYSHMPEDQIDWKECSYCSYRGKRKNDLQKHIEKLHMEPGKVKVQYGKHQCKECPFRAIEPSRLTEHKKQHHLTEGFKCTRCSYRSKTMGKLLSHEKLHDIPEDRDFVERLFDCPLCSHKAKRKANLKQHIKKMHTAKKGINWCELCGYGTKQKGRMDTHMKVVHENEGVIKNQDIKCEIVIKEEGLDTELVVNQDV